jgi:hypothetical protein
LKKFYKWYCKEDGPEIIKWIRTIVKKKDQKLLEEMLTESDVLNLIENAEFSVFSIESPNIYFALGPNKFDGLRAF